MKIVIKLNDRNGRPIRQFESSTFKLPIIPRADDKLETAGFYGRVQYVEFFISDLEPSVIYIIANSF